MSAIGHCRLALPIHYEITAKVDSEDTTKAVALDIVRVAPRSDGTKRRYRIITVYLSPEDAESLAFDLNAESGIARSLS
jgi:hypothetical protein